MTVARKIEGFIQASSWIRRMFEEGAELKKRYGVGNVYDFSLGNPNLPPPPSFRRVLREILDQAPESAHAYMPNTGLPETCAAVAERLSAEQGVRLSASEVIMTCGAAGALNIAFKALLDPGDEILVPAPCFVEYGFYADNHGGVLKTVPSRLDFQLDLTAIEAAIGPRTRIVLLNSPNNPTGVVYPEASLRELGGLLEEKSRALSRTLYLVADEPYRQVVFDGVDVPPLFSCYRQSIVCSSYSKDLSIPGERIGYAAVHPEAEHKKALLAGMALANRILGFVNAPALMQRAVARLQGERCDVAAYRRKRDLLCDGLAAAGYEFIRPQGTFYVFPRSPLADDVAFVQQLKEERVLVVPGRGFFGPGHFRIAFCVEDAVIENALPAFARAIRMFRE